MGRDIPSFETCMMTGPAMDCAISSPPFGIDAVPIAEAQSDLGLGDIVDELMARSR